MGVEELALSRARSIGSTIDGKGSNSPKNSSPSSSWRPNAIEEYAPLPVACCLSRIIERISRWFRTLFLCHLIFLYVAARLSQTGGSALYNSSSLSYPKPDIPANRFQFFQWSLKAVHLFLQVVSETLPRPSQAVLTAITTSD